MYLCWQLFLRLPQIFFLILCRTIEESNLPSLPLASSGQHEATSNYPSVCLRWGLSNVGRDLEKTSALMRAIEANGS